MTPPARPRRRFRRLSSSLVVIVGLLAMGGLWAAFAPSGQALSTEDLQTQVSKGRALFLTGCSSCHGLQAQGGTQAPSLIGVGPAAVDFQVSSGRMPLAQPGPQAQRKPVAFRPDGQKYTTDDIHALALYIGSLAPGPAIPQVDLADGDLQLGGSLFRTNCAQCHNFAGAGGALSGGKYAPVLKPATNEQVAEAIRTGPESMPVFGPGQLSQHDVNSLVAYVAFLRHTNDPGGSALGHLGPVPEGFVVFLVGMGGLIGAAFWIGSRS